MNNLLLGQSNEPLCDDAFTNFMNTWNQARHVTRTYAFVVISVQSVLLVYLAIFIYRNRK